MLDIESFLQKFTVRGEINFSSGDTLRELTKNVPHKPGVYLFESPEGSICYIGRAGTLMNNGEFREQQLQGRIRNKQDGMPRQRFLENKLEKTSSEHIKIRWFVTWDGNVQDIPAKVEAELLQIYFREYRKLPPWNKSI